MSLGILNNIAALYAENNLNSTQASLQTTLQQLSSGSRINSGADDPAGLAVSDGLGANEAALTQSSQNASDGVGLLQTADGALSQVTNLLDRAVTLATESANGTLTAGQVSSANQEYQNILTQIGNIGATTNFNSSNVFSSSATNIVVTDGTSSGLNTYADTVGSLTTASVGTSAGTAVVSNSVSPVTVQSAAAVTKVAGVYTLTPAVKTDTLSGQLSFTVGSGSEIDVTVAPGTTTSALKTQLMGDSSFTGAGLSANVTASTGALVITGPTSGANAAANTVAFTNTDLSDSVAVPTITGAPGTTASAGTASTGSLTVAGASSGDYFSGNIVLTQGSQTLTIAIASSSVFGSAATSGTVENQIATALAAQTDTNFAVATEGGTASNPVLNFTGSNNTTKITVTNTLTDATTSSGVSYTAGGAAGTAPKAGTYVLSAMGSSSDTFATGSTITINGEPVSLDGLDGNDAAAAITADTVLSGLGITAAYNTTSNKLTITGDAAGDALTVTGVSNLSDVSGSSSHQRHFAYHYHGSLRFGGDPGRHRYPQPAQRQRYALRNPQRRSRLGRHGQNRNDHDQGRNHRTGTGYSDPDRTVRFRLRVSRQPVQQLANQRGRPHRSTGTAAADQLTVTGSVTDSTVSTPGAGANFTAGSVSQRSAATAATVLTTVTSAVADVAYQRGTIGADVNELTSASNVASAEEVNLTSAQDTVTATDYGAAASNLSKYQILSQTGISALAQANSVQQEVLKLLQ